MGKRKVRIVKKNWDVLFTESILSGEGFIISEPAEIKLTGGKTKKSLYGSQSPLYGTSFVNESESIARHRCFCGSFSGKQWEGDTCPVCNTKVKERKMDAKKVGWMSLGVHKVINPYYYNLLSKLIGKKVFEDMVIIRQKVDRDGKRSIVPNSNEKPLSPYSGIGIENFMKDYDNIITYFKAKKKKNAEELEKLRQTPRAVFTSHIPIYTTALRPESHTSDSYYFTTIDRHINPLFSLVDSLEDATAIEVTYILQRIEDRLLKIWDYNFELINKKEGFIKHKLIGGSLNFTARGSIRIHCGQVF